MCWKHGTNRLGKSIFKVVKGRQMQKKLRLQQEPLQRKGLILSLTKKPTD